MFKNTGYGNASGIFAIEVHFLDKHLRIQPPTLGRF